MKKLSRSIKLAEQLAEEYSIKHQVPGAMMAFLAGWAARGKADIQVALQISSPIDDDDLLRQLRALDEQD